MMSSRHPRLGSPIQKKRRSSSGVLSPINKETFVSYKRGAAKQAADDSMDEIQTRLFLHSSAEHPTSPDSNSENRETKRIQESALSIKSPNTGITRHESIVQKATYSSSKAKPSEPTIQYPESFVRKPSRELIEYFYNMAISSKEVNQQQQLDEANTGLLSLEDVLLPAVAHCETSELKKLQAIAQRNHDMAQVKALEYCRAAIYQAIGNGIRAARDNRLERQANEAEWIRVHQEQQRQLKLQYKAIRQKERVQKQQERARQRAEQREVQKQQLKKTHPPNVEMWREVATLMTELAQLEKEERMWKQVQQELIVREEAVKVELEEAKKERELSAAETQQEDEDDVVVLKQQAKLTETIEGIVLNANVIKNTVGIVDKALDEADQVRKELVHKYRKDHQFYGYRGVHDPIGLLRGFSQE